MSKQARRFFVAGTTLCDVAFHDVVAGAPFCDVSMVLLRRIAVAGTRKRTKSSIFKLKVWNLKEVSHEMLVLTLQTLKVRGPFRVLRGRRNTLEASLPEKLKTSRTKSSFWKLVP